MGKSSEVRAALLDLRFIVLSLASCPTHHVSELVEYEPELVGTCDASAAGAGGIWVGHLIQPTVYGASNDLQTLWNSIGKES